MGKGDGAANAEQDEGAARVSVAKVEQLLAMPLPALKAGLLHMIGPVHTVILRRHVGRYFYAACPFSGITSAPAFSLSK